MNGGIIASVLTPHTPRMAAEENAPTFIRPLIEGSRQLGQWIRAQQPDCIVLHTTHWVSTFNWYATAHPRHEGLCIAEEAPDMITGLPYSYAGDPQFAAELIASGDAAGIPFRTNDNPHYRWDYGTFVPLKYIDPDASLKIVTIPTVILADLDECMRVGRLVDGVAQAQDKRVIFIASTALSHALVRGPEKWPSQADQQADARFIEMIEAGDISQAIKTLPDYSRSATAEMGGRVLASFLGAARTLANCSSTAKTFGQYAQSSGSGNLSIALSAD
ncbi:MAG: DODA-type extradiol aromatic ring-opening family dioxygenase [Gammaproteobacteria bacterium]